MCGSPVPSATAHETAGRVTQASAVPVNPDTVRASAHRLPQALHEVGPRADVPAAQPGGARADPGHPHAALGPAAVPDLLAELAQRCVGFCGADLKVPLRGLAPISVCGVSAAGGRLGSRTAALPLAVLLWTT